MEHQRDTDIPNWLKWGLTVFNRAGFPALAFIMVSYICFVTMKEQTRAIVEFKNALSAMTESINSNTESVRQMTVAIYKTR